MNKQTIPTALLLLALLLCPAPGVRAQTGPADAPAIESIQSIPLMPVDDVRPGMQGVGRTVFRGAAIEEFAVEILGVLKNYSPRQDMILARLSGGPLESTGVIQGMSGSPVYVDGKLVGAVAFAFPYAKDSVAGIQPIEQMLGVLEEAAAQPVQAAREIRPLPAPVMAPAAFIQNLFAEFRRGVPLHELAGVAPRLPAAAASLAPIQTPLAISGVSAAAMSQFLPLFTTLGFSPVQSGGAGGAIGTEVTGAAPLRLQPGSPVDASIVRGDITVTANGTVTHVDGDKVYAFGHPFLSAGPVNFPMSTAYVISVLPRLDVSSKIAVPVEAVGTFRQDRSTGIMGAIGEEADMIPVKLTVQSSNSTLNEYDFEVANDRYLTPLLVNFSVYSAITASERSLGEMTLDVSGTVSLKDYGPVNISNVFSGDLNGPSMAALAATAPVQYLMSSGYSSSIIDRIDLSITSSDRKTSATLERIVIDRNEVRPGESVVLSAYLRGGSGETIVERYPVVIPAGLSAGAIQLRVGDGTALTASELLAGAAGAPVDLHAAVRELNRLRRNDRLYVKVVRSAPGVMIRGEELPSLPPSMMAVVNTDRASSGGVAAVQNSTIAEFELPRSTYVIQGERSLTLTVKP